jgi:hypothetical protein
MSKYGPVCESFQVHKSPKIFEAPPSLPACAMTDLLLYLRMQSTNPPIGQSHLAISMAVLVAIPI